MPDTAVASYFSQNTHFPDARGFFADIRAHLAADGSSPFSTEAMFPFDLEHGSQIYLTLYQPGLKPIRWGTNFDGTQSSLQRILRRIRLNASFSLFAISDETQTRFLLEFVTSQQSVPKLTDLTDERLGPHRFEPGITGLAFRFDEKDYYYMPTQAYTCSHMTLSQVFTYLARRVGLKQANADAAVHSLLHASSSIQLIRSRAYVTFEDRAIELYRGYPTPVDASKPALEHALFASIDWLIRHQRPSGKFLYYYDAATDSTADFQHPNNPGYYNMLRHAGGTIALLRVHELKSNPRYLTAAKLSIDYLLTKSRTYDHDGQACRYVLDNKKAKLGGTGLALVALMHYRRLTGDDTYLTESSEMARHLLSQVAEDGEFIGYYIHPLFNDGRPLENLGDEVRRKLFSFYYPGEALLALALYERHAPLSDPARAEIRSLGRRAMNFLVNIRPGKYPDLFLALPSDGWFMQAIEEWWYHPEMRLPDCSGFVYGDADLMISHMYQRHNSPYLDYPGAFYYYYGQHALPDGARAEGLIAAHFLALKEGNSKLAERLLKHCRLAAHALMRTYNSPESLYAAKAPGKAVGAFRFKLTRQWTRVDAIQHTACFYARLLPFY